ncbi:TetR/AcrR family transcriptional regulator [Corynebacterium sp. H127]|uniref:TetR/AcrR family transcriptional regulator n=1 Tax=Corynebacterium sp. H127 TaxID=3133418 RepID=UPI0030AA1CD4
MPKLVDHEERRRTLAKAIVDIAGEKGLEGATLRAVAKQAGLSMGAVQHYFTDREAMLDFVLEFVQQQRGEKIRCAIEQLENPQPKSMLWAMVKEILFADETNLTFQKVHMMFVSRAFGHQPTAAKLGEGRATVVQLFEQLLGDSGAKNPKEAAETLWSLLESLPTDIILGQHTYDSAVNTTKAVLAAFGITDVDD